MQYRSRTFYRIAHKDEDLFAHNSHMENCEDLPLDGVCAFDSIVGIMGYCDGLFDVNKPNEELLDEIIIIIFKGLEIFDAGGDDLLGYVVEPIQEDYIRIPVRDFISYHKEFNQHAKV